jgi:hypothetical protein
MRSRWSLGLGVGLLFPCVPLWAQTPNTVPIPPSVSFASDPVRHPAALYPSSPPNLTEQAFQLTAAPQTNAVPTNPVDEAREKEIQEVLKKYLAEEAKKKEAK